MISENNKRFLRRISFLENFTDEELYGFFRILKGPQTLQNGDVLIKDGEVDKSLYIVLSGQFDIYKKKSQKKILIASVKKGEILGEMSEYIEHTRGVSAVVASLDAKILKVDITKYPPDLRLKIRENHCHILARRLIKRNDEFSELKREMANIIQNCEAKAHQEQAELRKENAELREQLNDLRLQIIE